MAAVSARLWWRQVWNFSKRRAVSDFVKARLAEEEHAGSTMKTWRSISLFVALPGCGFVTYNAYSTEMAHKKHEEEHGRREFVAYPHLRLRNKPFPWGDGNHTLIHNPHTNPLPDGYED